MRHHTHRVFNEFIPSGVGAVYTSSELNDNLGRFDQIGIQIVVDNISGKGSLDLWIEHSADGRNFQQRNNTDQTNPFNAGTGDISIDDLSKHPLWVRNFTDACQGVSSIVTATPSGPLLPFVRLRIRLGDNAAAHVKIWAVHRGHGVH